MDREIREHDRVRVVKNLPGSMIRRGMEGIVVHCYKRSAGALGYEVEFFNEAGETIKVACVSASDVVLVRQTNGSSIGEEE